MCITSRYKAEPCNAVVGGLLPPSLTGGSSPPSDRIPRQQPRNEAEQDFYLNKLDIHMMLNFVGVQKRRLFICFFVQNSF
ncbi:MAG: hypothetical protein V7K27_26335 [Nostoc sp.]|uniref:hypothetical protein n=1 Tax=Nostoc sp. TaxID=1180 RepID=UPI002FF71F72